MRRKSPFPTASEVKRAMGTVVVESRRRDGSAGCSLPCMECRRALSEVDAHVVCVDSEGEWVSCRARDLPNEGGVVTFADRRRYGLSKLKKR